MRTDLRRRVERLEVASRPAMRTEPGPHPLCPRCRRCGGVCLPSVAAVAVFADCAPEGETLCGCGTDCPTCGGPRSPMRLFERGDAACTG